MLWDVAWCQVGFRVDFKRNKLLGLILQHSYVMRFKLLCVGITRCHALSSWANYELYSVPSDQGSAYTFCQGDILWRVFNVPVISLCRCVGKSSKIYFFPQNLFLPAKAISFWLMTQIRYLLFSTNANLYLYYFSLLNWRPDLLLFCVSCTNQKGKVDIVSFDK